MATYATVAELAEYIGRAAPANAERILGFAERDIDRLIRLRGQRTVAGLKVNPVDLTGYQAAALSRATCAQAEYRIAKGEDFFIHAQHSRVSGPDFTTEGRLPYIGPKVYQELAGTGMAAGRLVSVPMVGLLAPAVSDEDLPAA